MTKAFAPLLCGIIWLHNFIVNSMLSDDTLSQMPKFMEIGHAASLPISIISFIIAAFIIELEKPKKNNLYQ